MKTFTVLNTSLIYHQFDVRIIANGDVHFDAWIGAFLRNNLLFACEQVMLPDTHTSLYAHINTFPLSDNHPMYRPLSEGFPRSYYLYLQSHNTPTLPCKLLPKNDVLCFSLVLIGRTAQYFQQFITAIQIMCYRGFGTNLQQFQLIDVSEVSHTGGRQVITNDSRLRYPTQLSDFLTYQQTGSCIGIELESPVQLIKASRRKSSDAGYVDKGNTFPSFTQLIRSLAYRLAKLNCLYAKPTDTDLYAALELVIPDFIAPAADLNLNYANITRVSWPSTAKKDQQDRMLLIGFVGEMEFHGRFEAYLPMLLFMEKLGVGHGLVYGLGKYRLKG